MPLRTPPARRPSFEADTRTRAIGGSLGVPLAAPRHHRLDLRRDGNWRPQEDTVAAVKARADTGNPASYGLRHLSTLGASRPGFRTVPGPRVSPTEEPRLTPSEQRVLQTDGPATAGDVQLAMKLRVGATSEAGSRGR